MTYGRRRLYERFMSDKLTSFTPITHKIAETFIFVFDKRLSLYDRSDCELIKLQIWFD